MECLGRSGDGYSDGSIDAYWHFWKESRAALVVDLPTAGPEEDAIDDSYMDGHRAAIRMRNACYKAIEGAGLKVTP
ncbi:hypothetical protein D3C84_1209870 [compost metagenome]